MKCRRMPQKEVGIVILSLVLAWWSLGQGDWHDLTQKLWHGRGDELLVLFIFEKFATNLTTPGIDLWDGGIFYPAVSTLGFAEVMAFPALVYTFFKKLGAGPFFSLHLVLIVFSALNFLAMWIFSRRFLSFGSSLLAAFFFSFSMVRMGQAGHFQLLFHFPTPLFALAFWNYFFGGMKRLDLWGMVGLMVLQWYSCVYLGEMLVVMSFVAFLILVFQKKIPKQKGGELLMAGVVLLAGLWPLFALYSGVSRTHGIVRPLSEALIYSGYLQNFFYAPPGNLWHKVTSMIEHGGQLHEKYYFLGLGGLLLWVKGAYAVIQTPLTKGLKAFLLSLFVINLLLFMGPAWGLYHLFYVSFPGFQALRVPARFGLLLLFFDAFLIGWAMHKIKAHSLRQRGFQLGLALVFVFIVFENQVHSDFVELEPTFKKSTTFIQSLHKVEAVTYYPLEKNEPLRIWESTQYEWPIVNGYSGFYPKSYLNLLLLQRKTGLSQQWLSTLQELVASKSLLVVEKSEVGEVERENLRRKGKLIYQDLAVWIYEL